MSVKPLLENPQHQTLTASISGHNKLRKVSTALGRPHSAAAAATTMVIIIFPILKLNIKDKKPH